MLTYKRDISHGKGEYYLHWYFVDIYDTEGNAVISNCKDVWLVTMLAHWSIYRPLKRLLNVDACASGHSGKQVGPHTSLDQSRSFTWPAQSDDSWRDSQSLLDPHVHGANSRAGQNGRADAELFYHVEAVGSLGTWSTWMLLCY